MSIFPGTLMKRYHLHLMSSACASLLLAGSVSNAAMADSGTSNALFIPPSHTTLFQQPSDLSKAPANLNVDHSGDAQIIGIIDQEATGEQDEQMDKLRYKLLQARLNLETGHVYSATKSLNEMAPAYSDNSEFLGFLANAENYGGNWPQAQYLLNNAHALAPENQDVIALQNSIGRDHAQNIELDYDWLRYGNSNENISQLGGYVNANSRVQIGALLEDNYILARDVRLSNGEVGDANANKQQGQIYAQYSTINGQRLEGAVYGNNDTAGVGGYYTFLNPLGETALTAEYQRPYWDMPEAVMDDAVRDRLAFMHTIKPSNRLTINGGMSLNRYDVSNENDVSDSIGADGSIIYQLNEGIPYHTPTYDIGYTLDAEYIKEGKFALDNTGGTSRILPLVSREIHTLFGDANYDFTPTTWGYAMAGYQYDRLGGNGPVLEGKITHEFTRAFYAQLRASYGLDATNSQNSITQVGGYLQYRF